MNENTRLILMQWLMSNEEERLEFDRAMSAVLKLPFQEQEDLRNRMRGIVMELPLTPTPLPKPCFHCGR